MAFDRKCEELAAHFLPAQATKRLCDGLAQAIQDAVEEWITSEAALIRKELGERHDYDPRYGERAKDRDN